jgi:hypothetical protein
MSLRYLLALSLILPLATLTTPAHDARAAQCGDVDGNGSLSATDALLVLKKAVGEDTELNCASTNGDGAPSLEERVAALEELLAHVTVEGDRMVLSGVNLQIVSGEGATDAEPNGLGNLIIGYDEGDADAKTGSHNLVVGPGHGYTRFGGIVAGSDNSINADFASAIGGSLNTSAGASSVVTGGFGNVATAANSAICGGETNRTRGKSSTVTGGIDNLTLGTGATVTGGMNNVASGNLSSVSGGSGGEAPERASWRAGRLVELE